MLDTIDTVQLHKSLIEIKFIDFPTENQKSWFDVAVSVPPPVPDSRQHCWKKEAREGLNRFLTVH